MRSNVYYITSVLVIIDFFTIKGVHRRLFYISKRCYDCMFTNSRIILGPFMFPSEILEWYKLVHGLCIGRV